MEEHHRGEEVATRRLQWLVPLLADGLDAAKIQALKAAICSETGLSERTLRRYLARYHEQGFVGLRPKDKGRSPSHAIAEELLQQAIVLRREIPGRSIAQIIRILEWEGRAPVGALKRSTLQQQLAARGYSSRQMRLYAQTGVAARRYQRVHRNQLWMSDLKYGPYLPIRPGGRLSQVYLVVMLDDATRLVLQAAFYPSLEQQVVEDCFRQSVQKYGRPEAVYFDNGKQYRTKWMARTCSKLGIRLLYTRPYAPESKGKIERFNRTVDSFLAEVALDKPKDLSELNARFAVWLSECYQNKPHSALAKGTSPETAYRSDRQPLRFVDPELLKEAFWHRERRKVDKSGCVSFQGRLYEVGLAFIGRSIEISYDPEEPTMLTARYEGHTPWTIKPLVIGERVGPRPKLPETLAAVPADASRLLAAASERYATRQEQHHVAISYRAVYKEGGQDV